VSDNFWTKMPPKKRAVLAGVALFVLLLVLAASVSFNNAQTGATSQPLSANNFALPGQKDVSLVGLAASLDALKDATLNNQKGNQEAIKAEQERLAQLEVKLTDAKNKPSDMETETLKQLSSLQKTVDDLKTKGVPDSTPSLDAKLNNLPPPSGAVPSGDDVSAPVAPPVPEKPKFRVISGDVKPVDEDAVKPAPKVAYIPSGSMFEGVLLNGMDAPTSAVTQKNPVPALIRVKTDAVLPNGFRHDVRECFVIVSGFGVLSTERAQLRTESFSCIKNDGSSIDQKIDGYVVGEDGRVGMRGRLISKQGQLIAQSLISGMLQGIGTLMQPVAVPQLNTSPGTQAQFQTPNPGALASAGIGGGISATAKNVSAFYLSMAKEIFPIIEVDAGRKVTIVILKGFDMSLGDTAQ
jgi:conjugal transfer pilus assembly protein TraB